MSKGRILFCNVFPQAPAAARADLCITVRCMVLIAVDRAFGAASVGNEDEVILGENDAFLDAVYFALDGFCYFFPSLISKITLVTSVLNWKSTPASSRYFFIGRIRDSYWLYFVNFSAEKSGSPPMW